MARKTINLARKTLEKVDPHSNRVNDTSAGTSVGISYLECTTCTPDLSKMTELDLTQLIEKNADPEGNLGILSWRLERLQEAPKNVGMTNQQYALIYGPLPKISFLSSQMARMMKVEQTFPNMFAIYSSHNSGNSLLYSIYGEIKNILGLKKSPPACFRLYEELSCFGPSDKYDYLKNIKRLLYCSQESIMFEAYTCGSFHPFAGGPGMEDAYDFWVKNTNIRGLNVFTTLLQELELNHLRTDPILLFYYKEALKLSILKGARMFQFLMSPDTMDKYTWTSARGVEEQVIAGIRNPAVHLKKFQEDPNNYTECIFAKKSMAKLDAQGRIYTHPDLFRLPSEKFQIREYQACSTNVYQDAAYEAFVELIADHLLVKHLTSKDPKILLNKNGRQGKKKDPLVLLHEELKTQS
ncbi:hypothetical protein Bealeia2_00059 [Candidatus Bealeia paramacronuclearis]|uniref:hypothetical protein n=1 Tax=Candidatus Bealeia paramacronuclearis TaxID=1921001 RepID=UPI002B662AEE|nr:hypothetical protein [Candidatus Bealeia paramacronuclearis]